MQVLIITEGYPPDRGGVATSSKRIAIALNELGAKPRVITYRRGAITDFNTIVEETTDHGVPVARIGPFFKTAGSDIEPIPNSKQKALLRRRFIASMQSHLRMTGMRPDVIFSLYLINAGFLATFLAKELDIPHVAGVRGNDIGRNLLDPTLLYASKFVMDAADRVVAVNQHLRRKAIKVFPDLEPKITVIPNSIAPPQLPDRAASRHRLLTRTGWKDNDFILCFIGSFREKKGCFELLDAICDPRVRVRENIRLLVIGADLDTTERWVIGKRFAALKAEGIIHHTGKLSEEEVYQTCSGADVIVMPSLDDGMANGLLEGMAAGLCPLVTTVFKDVVTDGITGVVVEPGDVEMLTVAILSLANSPQRVSALAQAAQVAVIRRSPQHEAAEYIGLFAGLISKAKEQSMQDISR